MKVSLNWLKTIVPLELTPDELAAALTMAGLEVEAVSDRFEYLDSVRVGHVVAVKDHPNADRLKVCDVDIGDRTLTVVCGAPNVRAGMLSPIALPGTRFPDDRILKKGIIRGVASEGMLCSEAELELGTDTSGIMALDDTLTKGEVLSKALNLSDTMLEIDLTPNRPDCLSMIGTAREIAAIVKKDISRSDTPCRFPEKKFTSEHPLWWRHRTSAPGMQQELLKISRWPLLPSGSRSVFVPWD